MTTPAPAEAAQGAVSDQPLRRRLRKKNTETPIVVSEAQSATTERLPGSSKSEEGQRTLASGAEGHPASPAESTNPPAYWTPRQTWERTDLDYYQRVLREREHERVALLT